MSKFKHQYAILGMGISGRSVANYLLSQGASVVGCDRRADSEIFQSELQELIKLGLVLRTDDAVHFPEDCRAFILSPGVPLSHPLCQKARAQNAEIIGEIEFACRQLKCPFIGITGTNGKTTVTSQTAHTLNFHKIPAKAMGNIGTPLSELLSQPPDNSVVVLELSSYQLETMNSKVLDAGIVLNLSPDHLDRYPSMEAYGTAKLNLGRCLKQNDSLFVNEQLLQDFPSLFRQLPFDVKIFDRPEQISSLFSLPSYEKQNLAAVYALCSRWGLSWDDVLEAAKTFKKGKHRIEHVAVINGVHFYDDSKGTNVDAVLKAVEAIPGKIVLIAGGLAKGAHFDCWLKPFHTKVDRVYAIGSAAGQLQSELGGQISVITVQSLEEAVRVAYRAALSERQAVLLSPGCASFDMFRDYEHRGDVFQQCVRELEKEGSQ